METLGKYGFIEKLGEGFPGPVYRAYNSTSHQYVTLITYREGSRWEPELKEKFLAECGTMLQLNHPNLAVTYEQGEDRNIVFLAEELLEGKNLAQMDAEKASATLEWKIALMAQAAAGLAHAHTHGVLHRRLRPGIIHVLPDGTAKVSGFGCGFAPSPPDAAPQTPSADIYQAPEQLAGRDATAQSDIFSLGLIFYELVTGVHPFQDADINKTLDAIQHQAQFPTVEQFPDLPFNLWPILERCLAKEAEERYPSMQDFWQACRGMLDELAEDTECMRIELQTALPRLRRAAKRPNVPPALAKLRGDVEQVLLGVNDSNYQALNRLLKTLTEQHRLVEAQVEASAVTLPDVMGTPPEPMPAPGIPDNLCAEPPCSPPEVEPVPAGTVGTDSLFAAEFVNEAPSESYPEDTQHSFEPVNGLAAVEIPSPRPVEPAENRSAPEPAKAAASAQAGTDAIADSPRLRTIPKDSFSDLLRKIDQGQESTQKLVDSFLAGRQAKAAAKPNPGDAGEDISSDVDPARPSNVSIPDAVPPPGAAKTTATQTPLPAEDIQADYSQAARGVAPLEAVAPPPIRHSRLAGHKTAFTICAATVLLALTFAIPGVRERIISSLGKNVLQRGLQAMGLGKADQTPASDPFAIAVKNQLNFARRDILLEETEILHAVGRRQEAKTFVLRLLELYPDYQPARDELEQITAEINSPPTSDPTSPVQKLLNSAASAIRSGNLAKAKIDLDAAEQMEPGQPEVARLRKSLEAKKNELEQSAARDHEAQLIATQKRESEALALRAEDLFRQGKYDDVIAAVDEHTARNPASPEIQGIRGRTEEVRQSLRTYETALGSGKFAEAQAALDNIERINPSDPGLAAMRKRAEPPAPGSASLSVYPIAEPAALLLDDRAVGAGGEVVNQTIPSGRHKLAARSGNGQIAELAYDFANGQAVTLVYDVPGQVLRTMVESDRARVARSKAKMQTHRFAVEHPHGLLRGSCKGDMIVDYYHVVYQPSSGAHGFSVAYKDFKLRMDNKNAVLLFAANGTEFFTFKLPDAQSAQSLRKLWDDLAALDK